MKIKDNLDLQGYLLQNFCVDNYDSLDSISNKGDGRMVFLTGNSTDAKYRHVNVWDGTNFKALAYLEDVASNADFIALQEKVALLAGDVDTDAIISNMKEVSAFLEGFAEDASLMNLLNSKLSTNGGTIEGGTDASPLFINTTAASTRIGFKKNGTTLGYFGFGATDTPAFVTASGGVVPLLHERNYMYYALPLTGGTLTNILFLEYANPRIVFKTDANTTLGSIGFKDSALSAYITADNKWYALLHSGNVGEYAVTRHTSVSDLNSANLNSLFIASFQATNRPSSSTNYAGGLTFSVFKDANNDSRAQIAVDPSFNVFVRGYKQGTWYDWKTIAFTDSNVAGATKLVYTDGIEAAYAGANGHLYVQSNLCFNKNAQYIYGMLADGTSRALILGVNAKNSLLIGYGLMAKGQTLIYGKDILFATNGEIGRMFINSSGNVTIGNGDLAGSKAKLYVDGKVKVSNRLILGNNDNFGIWKGSSFSASMLDNDIAIYGENKIVLYGGNVLIGTTDDNGSGAKLQVKGDLYVDGNIISTKEVSAGGAGEEGSGSGSGAGAFHSESIAVGATQTTIAHGLGTDDIVVSIYEKDATSGLWSMILTDIEITDANNIRVTFGSATTVEHKVVIMGAVA